MAEVKDGMISPLGYGPWCCCVGAFTMSSRWGRERNANSTLVFDEKNAAWI